MSRIYPPRDRKLVVIYGPPGSGVKKWAEKFLRDKDILKECINEIECLSIVDNILTGKYEGVEQVYLVTTFVTDKFVDKARELNPFYMKCNTDIKYCLKEILKRKYSLEELNLKLKTIIKWHETYPGYLENIYQREKLTKELRKVIAEEKGGEDDK